MGTGKRLFAPCPQCRHCAKMLGMNQEPQQPIHWDKHKSTINLSLILALVIAVIGLFTGQELFVVAGLGMAAFSWLTSPQQYYIYSEALVITYGRPRPGKVISFAQVSHIEMLSLPMGERLRVRLVSGRPEILAARDAETFRNRLDAALADYRGAHPGEGNIEGPSQINPPY